MPCPKALMFGETNTGIFVPDEIAKCPECGGVLIVQAHAWQEPTGLPIADDLDISCINDSLNDDEAPPQLWHKHRQSEWQPVIDDVRKWTCAVSE